MAVITFVNAGMLAGLLGIGVPLFVHLLNRHRPRPVVFPTIRFVSAAIASQSRLYRWRQWLLLALRCAFVALLALAFARPSWYRSARAAREAEGGIVAVLIVDASASMGYARGRVTLATEAAARAAEILDRLDAATDRANLIVADYSPKVSFPDPSTNLPALKRDLENVRAVPQRARLDAALELAAAQLGAQPGLRRDLHILSDMQRTNWSDLSFSSLPRGTRVTVHPIGGDARRRNLAITSATLTPARPVAGQPARLSVQVANFSPEPASCDLTVVINDRDRLARAGLKIPPGLQQGVEFPLRFNRPGVHEVVLSIPPDGLTADNRYYLAVRVEPKLPVALITDADRDEVGSSAYFLDRALAPFAVDRSGRPEFTRRGGSRPSAAGGIDVRAVRGAALSAEDLVDREVAIVDSVGQLSSAGVAALSDFLSNGGGVLWFLGPGADPENLGVLDASVPNLDILPFQLGQRVDRTITGSAGRITAGLFDSHPVLKPFRGEAMRGLRAMTFNRYYATQPGRRGAEIIATFDGGDVAIGGTSVAAGKLLVCNFSPMPGYSDAPKHAAFPALLHRMTEYLRPERWVEQRPHVGMGITRRFTLEPGQRGLDVLDPQGARLRAVRRDEGRMVTVTIPQAKRLGFYRVRVANRPIDAVGVNLDPDESNLTVIDSAIVGRAMAAPGTLAPTSLAESDEATPREGTPLWHWAMFAAVGALAVEMFCLWYWKR